MKQKICILITGFLFTMNFAFAQGQGSITAGGGLLYGSEIETLGLGVNGQYFITDNLAAQVGLNFFFPNKQEVSIFEVKSSLWTINLNANYYIDIENETIMPYALGGINISNSKVSSNIDFGDDITGFGPEGTNTDFGLNLGGGADFYVSDIVIPFAQIKYVISDFDQLVIMGGVRININ